MCPGAAHPTLCRQGTGSDGFASHERMHAWPVVAATLTLLVFPQRANAENVTGTDRELPQVGRTRDLLLRGLAVHHGGLLPIIKEVP